MSPRSTLPTFYAVTVIACSSFRFAKLISPRICLLSFALFLITAWPVAARQTQPSLSEMLEHEDCATLDKSKTKICKYDYKVDGKKIEAFTFRPLTDGKYPGIVLLSSRDGAKTLFNVGIILSQQNFACLAISEPGYGKSEGTPDFMGPASIDAFAIGFKKFKREPFVDANKMGVFGYSRGGMAAS